MIQHHYIANNHKQHNTTRARLPKLQTIGDKNPYKDNT